ncbi:MAG: MFS transporter, partial [Pseudomonadales bacterium]|nr:MFS transporter [Pseudomonadales bacterium]
MKAWGANNLLTVTIAQTGLAMAQPFILNAVTKVGAKWFPVQERATVAGLGSLAQYIGIIVALAVTPMLINEVQNEGFGIERMLWIYGMISIAGAVLLLVFMREEPPTPPSSEEFTKRISPVAGLKDIFRNRDMQLLLLLFFIGLGIFNAVSTCIDQICENLTIDETGMVGG